jgi:hypothetical protein
MSAHAIQPTFEAVQTTQRQSLPAFDPFEAAVKRMGV